MSELLKYEQTYNIKVLDNSTFRTKQTYIGYGIEDRERYDALMAEGLHSNIVFTDRVNIPDMETVKDTLKISQINNTHDSQFDFETAFRPCSCLSCLDDPLLSSSCKNKESRNIKQSNIRKAAEEVHDEYGVLNMKIDDLKFELRSRRLRVGGQKKELVDRLIKLIEGEYGDDANDDQAC